MHAFERLSLTTKTKKYNEEKTIIKKSDTYPTIGNCISLWEHNLWDIRRDMDLYLVSLPCCMVL